MTKIKPCPFCKSEFLTVYVNRTGVSYIRCDFCSGQVSIDCTRCSDPLTGNLMDALTERWNNRADGRGKEDAEVKDGDD